jgi:hypothetical protein
MVGTKHVKLIQNEYYGLGHVLVTRPETLQQACQVFFKLRTLILSCVLATIDAVQIGEWIY